MRRADELRRALRGTRALAGAWRWGWTAARDVRAGLRESGLEAVVTPPPRLPARAAGAMLLALRVRRATCLERSLVLQAWLVGRGRRHAVVVGVARDDRFAAHAWVDGVDPAPARFVEISRVAPRG